MTYSKRSARRTAGGIGALIWAIAVFGSLALTIVFWVVLIKLGLAGIHYLNTH